MSVSIIVSFCHLLLRHLYLEDAGMRCLTITKNTVANQEFRASRDKCAWMLNSYVFNQKLSLIRPCISNKTASKVFQLETGPRNKGQMCFQPKLRNRGCYDRLSVVPDSLVPVAGEKADG